jgi:hypothetical protein
VEVSASQTVTDEAIPVSEYVRRSFVPLSRLAHDWEMHTAVFLTPAEERTMVREPAHAVPASVAQRLGKVRVLMVPFVACMESGDLVCFSKPDGETHSAVWVESDERVNLVLSCRELDSHDTGFEFLASISELLRPRLAAAELEGYTQLLETELQMKVSGEIDEDAAAAKQPLLRNRALRRHSGEHFERYRDTSFASTLAEYMHGLWHDVQIRLGPEHLPYPQIRQRMELMAELFPPNPGYRVFAEELEKQP